MHRFNRWLYRGHRTNPIGKVLTTFWARFSSLGLTHNYMETLEVSGRKSGRIISLPVVIAIVDGQRYLVSMLGENVQWVRNVRAANGRAALRSGRLEQIRLEEVAVEQRARILKTYLRLAPGARPHIPVSKDAPLAEFERIAADYPTFRVVSAQD
ncbi:MAG: nitroreductase family deazaflavin-dependent oxidoreductase [Anaerolineae bacterium]|nr:nitroreductase family deazaflavin-dependent oxidoreductase [Anaerolineae bacterium]